MNKSNFKSMLELKPRQQTNQTEESLLANQKVGSKRRLKHSVVKQARKTLGQYFSFNHHLHLGPTYVDVNLYVVDDGLGCHQQEQKQVDVFGSDNDIAETINTNINPNEPTNDGE